MLRLELELVEAYAEVRLGWCMISNGRMDAKVLYHFETELR